MLSTERGDIVALLDGAGAAFAGYRYDEWGNPLGAGNQATGIWTQQTGLIGADLASQIAARQILRYAGYAYDVESGLYYCSARYYDPVTRQFLSKDEAKADGEESAYQYCGGEPVGQLDPAGQGAVKMKFPTYWPGRRAKVGGYLHAVLILNAGYAQERLLENIGNSDVVKGFIRTWRWWAYDMCRGGQPWDLKLAAPEGDPRTRKYMRFSGRLVSAEQFGNINIGYTAAAVGIPLPFATGASFAAHVSHGWKEAWESGYPIAKSLWAGGLKNEFLDHKWMAFGYRRYFKHGSYSRHTWFVF
jgi:RHS repeat-associated protein